MKNTSETQNVETKKVVAIASLYSASVLIMAVGVFFSILSFVNGISLQVMNTSVHGAVFGIVAFFLGLRYFISVSKLKSEVYKTTSKFSWRNFKHNKNLNKS